MRYHKNTMKSPHPDLISLELGCPPDISGEKSQKVRRDHASSYPAASLVSQRWTLKSTQLLATCETASGSGAVASQGGVLPFPVSIEITTELQDHLHSLRPTRPQH